MSTDYRNLYLYVHRNGWCVGCGRERAENGRCVNCDAWWASPLVRVGGPLILVTIALLALTVATLRPARPPRMLADARTAPSLVAAPPPPRFSRVPAEQAPQAAPFVPPVAAAGLIPVTPPGPGLGPLRLSEPEKLRRLSAWVDTVIAADDAARRGNAGHAPAFDAFQSPSLRRGVEPDTTTDIVLPREDDAAAPRI